MDDRPLHGRGSSAGQVGLCGGIGARPQLRHLLVALLLLAVLALFYILYRRRGEKFVSVTSKKPKKK